MGAALSRIQIPPSPPGCSNKYLQYRTFFTAPIGSSHISSRKRFTVHIYRRPVLSHSIHYGPGQVFAELHAPRSVRPFADRRLDAGTSRWRLCRLFGAGPKPDQHKNENAGTQSDDVCYSQIAIVPSCPCKEDRNCKDRDHHRRQSSLHDHAANLAVPMATIVSSGTLTNQ